MTVTERFVVEHYGNQCCIRFFVAVIMLIVYITTLLCIKRFIENTNLIVGTGTDRMLQKAELGSSEDSSCLPCHIFYTDIPSSCHTILCILFPRAQTSRQMYTFSTIVAVPFNVSVHSTSIIIPGSGT